MLDSFDNVADGALAAMEFWHLAHDKINFWCKKPRKCVGNCQYSQGFPPYKANQHIANALCHWIRRNIIMANWDTKNYVAIYSCCWESSFSENHEEKEQMHEYKSRKYIEQQQVLLRSRSPLVVSGYKTIGQLAPFWNDWTRSSSAACNLFGWRMKINK